MNDHRLLESIHADVHGIRGDLLSAIEKSQTAIMNRLSLIEAKIGNLDGITAEDLARIDALTKEGARLVTILKGVDAQT